MVEVRGGSGLGKALGAMSDSVSKASKVDVGFLENSTYPDGTSVPMVAAIQEYGAPKARFPIPARPFFRTMIKEKSGEWPKAVADLLKMNKLDTYKTLDQMGQAIKGQLQQSIVDMNSPALSPVTLMLRALVGPNGKVEGIGQVYQAIRLVQAGQTPDSYLRSKGKRPKAGGQAVSAKPLVWTGHLLNSVDYKVS